MEYKKLILKMLDDISDTDTVFLQQIYTLFKRHMERAGRRIQDKEKGKG